MQSFESNKSAVLEVYCQIIPPLLAQLAAPMVDQGSKMVSKSQVF